MNSDDFSGGLDPVWSFFGPAGTSAGTGSDASDAFLTLSTPSGDFDVYDDNNAARLLQSVGDEDFSLEARFLSVPSARYQLQGFLVEQDAQNWLRFDTYSDGSNLRAFGAVTVDGDSSTRFNVVIPDGSAAYLRLERSGDSWTFRYSADGVSWTTAGSFTHALNVSAVGPMAGSTGGAPGFTARIDYVEFGTDPILDEDDGFTPPGNTAPVASDDALSTLAGTALTIDVAADLLGNDSDPDGDPLSLAGFTQPTHGTLVDNGDGTLSYIPDAGYEGPDSFTYTLSDGDLTDTATVTLSVTTPGNTAPVASDDALSTLAGTALTIDVAADLLGNDSDPDGDPLSLAGFTQPTHGTLVDNGDGTLSYIPDAGYEGPDSFTYTLSDGDLTDTATVTLSVTTPGGSGVSDDFSGGLDPVWSFFGPAGTSAGTGSDASDAFLTLSTPSGDFDVYDDNNAARLLQSVGDEDFSLEARFLSVPSARYQLQGFLVEQDAQNWLRFDTYSDGSNLRAFGAVTVDGDSSTRFNVVIPDGSAAYLRLERSGDSWTFRYSADGVSWTTAGSFTHALNVSAVGPMAGSTGGAPGFTARIDYVEFGTDPILDEDDGFTPPGNTAPVASDDALSTLAGTALTIDVAADLLGNDSDPDGDPLSLAGFTQPTHGTLVDNGDGTLSYIPDAGYEGPDSFTYTLSDGDLTDTATVTLSVTTPGNTAPVASDDALSTLAGTALTIDVAADLLGNDSDPDGDPLSLAGFTQPTHGTLVDNGDGTLSYIPDAGYEGPDSFTYTLSDGDLTDTATVTLSVTTPGGSGVSDDFSGGLDPVWSFFGPAGTSAGTGSDASDAFLTLSTPSGDFDVYDDNNAARLLQSVGDEDFSLEARFLSVPSARYQLQGFLVEQDAQNWLRFDTYSDGSNLRAFGAVTVDGDSSTRFNVVIPDGSAAYLRLERSGDSWTFRYSADGVSWTTAGSFTHALNVSAVGPMAGSTGGAPGFTARIDYVEFGTDPILDEDDGFTPPGNTAPVASDDALSTLAGTALTIDVAADLLGNDSDPDGDPLSLAGFTQPTHGTLVDNGDGTLSYIPDAGYEGPDSFTYTLSDGDLTDTATVTLSVTTPGNTAPVASDDALSTLAGTALTIDVAADLLGNDSDPDGDPLSLAGFTQPTHGTLVDNGDGTLSYIPDAGYEGPDSFTYTLSDGDLTDTATVTLSVTTPGGSGVSDDFSGGLDPVWSFFGPAGTSAGTGSDASDAFLTLSTPSGDFDVYDDNNAARLLQSVGDEDFSLEARFLSVPSARYQLQGFLVEQDAQNWLRFDTYSDGSNLRAFGAVTVDGDSSTRFNVVIPDGSAAYLRLERSGDSWTFRYSADGVSWTTAGSFTHALNVSAVGPMAGSTGGAPGFTARIDYVEFGTDPILDEDDGFTPPGNTAPVASDDALSTLAGTALTIDVAADLLGNDSDPDGDPLSLAGFTQPTHGTLVDNGDGTLSYIPDAGYEGPDSFTYTLSDGDLTDTATVTLSVGDQIDVWYGSVQTFGDPGEGQKWINILGNVVFADLVSLTYSLNGGLAQTLSVGPDTRRLENTGDFNVDIAFADLDPTAANDVVTITATYGSGEVFSRDVTIDYESGKRWDADYSVDWSSVTDIQDVAQIVDGLWTLDGGGVRTAEPGYDRILSFGDRSWDNYEANFSLTVNDITSGTPRDGSGLGFGMLWNGHSNDPISNWQPLSGYNPIVSPFYNTRSEKFILHDHPDWSSPHLDKADFSFDEGATYNVTVRVEQTDLINRTYSFKIWEEGTAEPVTWLLQGTDVMDEPINGAFVMIAHHWDITFHDVDFAEIEGDDILMGTAGSDLLVAVDTADARPGEGERDVLVGEGGADVFVFGDSGGSFYDDGDGASAGLSDFGYVWDFVSGSDQILLAGMADDYLLSEDAGGVPEGTAIWRAGTGSDTDELIAVVRDVYGLSLGSSDFLFDSAIA